MHILPVHTPAGYDPLNLLKPLAAALAGEGPAVAPYAGDLPPALTTRPPATNGAERGDARSADIAAIVSTSGSTGTAKQTMLSVDALAASSMATAVRLRGEGQWLLALPAHYIAGLQVLVRSLYAGTRPEVVDMSGGFDTHAFTAAAGEMTDPHRYVSLVPTQLRRLLDSPDPSTIGVLRRFNAILLGGGPAPADLLAAADGEGLKLVSTYGMSETCGGCIYNGRPLDDVQVKIDDGRIWLGGPLVAEGYLDQPQLTAEHFIVKDGMRWYRTDDTGEFDDHGRLHVLGRVDDMVITGGIKVSAAAVQTTLEAVDGIDSAFVAGIDDAEWGAVVAAVVVGAAEVHDAAVAAVRAELGPQAVPKALVMVDELPMLSTGKPDRQRLIGLLNRAYCRGTGE